jgi:RNA polymerase sigma-70 factor (ECF subfamily)
MAPEDAELVARIVSGDRDAGETVYRRYVQYVAATVLRLLANAAETEDVVQDTFAIAFARMATLRDPNVLRSWLAQIAVSQVQRRFRRRRLLRLLGLDAGTPPSALDAVASRDASAEVRSELRALTRVLETISAGERIAWCLRYVEGATLEEIADKCQCSLATAKRRIAATHKRVRAAVDVEDTAIPLWKPTLAASPKVKA